MPQYDRLSALDASFLHMERLETPMHVGAMSILEGEPFFDADGHFRIGEVRDLVAPAQDGLWMAMGIVADAAQRTLWVASTAEESMQGATAEDAGRGTLGHGARPARARRPIIDR